MKWLNLSLSIEEHFEIQKIATAINHMTDEQRTEIVKKIATAQKLQEKAIQQMTAEIFQKELNQIEPRR